MTLEEFKAKVYTLIEEYSEEADDYTEDTDLAAKMNHVTNNVMHEVVRFKKIYDYTTINIEFSEGETEYSIDMTDIDNMIYQVETIRGVESIVIGKRVIFTTEGTAKIYYSKYPEPITEETEDSYEFELDTDALECMVLGVAGNLLMADVANDHGQMYLQRYRELLERLDSRNAQGGIYIDGGVEV